MEKMPCVILHIIELGYRLTFYARSCISSMWIMWREFAWKPDSKYFETQSLVVGVWEGARIVRRVQKARPNLWKSCWDYKVNNVETGLNEILQIKSQQDWENQRILIYQKILGVFFYFRWNKIQQSNEKIIFVI